MTRHTAVSLLLPLLASPTSLLVLAFVRAPTTRVTPQQTRQWSPFGSVTTFSPARVSSQSTRLYSTANATVTTASLSEEEAPTSSAALLEDRTPHQQRHESAGTSTNSWLSYQQATFVQEPAEASSAVRPYESSPSSSTSVPWFTELNKARILLLAAAALYGTNFSVVKVLDESLPVGIAATLRFGIATLCTLPWLLAPPKQQQQQQQPESDSSRVHSNLFAGMDEPTVGAIVTGVEVGLWNSIGYLAQAVGLQTTDASKSAFLCSLAVVIVPLLEFMTGKRLQARELVGAGVAVVGVGFLELGGGSSADVLFTQGDLASLLQPLAFGIAFWRMESAMRKYPNEANRNSAAQVLAVFCSSLLYCFVTERESLMNAHQIVEWISTPDVLGALFWTGTVTTALTVYMEAVALKTLSAAETTVLLSAEPLFGALFASVLIGETFGMDSAIGAGLIVAGCIYSNLGLEGILGQRSSVDNKDASYTNVVLEQQLQDDSSTTTTISGATKKPSPLLVKAGLAGVASSIVAATAKTAAVNAAASEEIDLVVEEVLRNTSDSL